MSVATAIPHLTHLTLPDVSGVTATARERASDLASSAAERIEAAAERIEDFPERVVELAAIAIPALRPPRRRSRRPLLLVAIIVAVVAGVVIWRRRTSGGATSFGTPVDAPGEPPVSAVS